MILTICLFVLGIVLFVGGILLLILKRWFFDEDAVRAIAVLMIYFSPILIVSCILTFCGVEVLYFKLANDMNMYFLCGLNVLMLTCYYIIASMFLALIFFIIVAAA